MSEKTFIQNNKISVNNITGGTGSFQTLLLNSKNINLGNEAGIRNTSTNSINIGYLAGPTGSTNSIVLNASGKELHSTGPTGGFYVNPIASYSGSTGPFFLLGYGADRQIVQVTGTALSDMNIGGGGSSNGGTGTFYGTGSFQSLSLNGLDLSSLTNQPYAPSGVSVTNGANDCYITFNYPIQYQLSFMSQPLPLITAASVSIKENVIGGTYTDIYKDAIGTDYIATSLTSNVVKKIRLRNLSGKLNGIYTDNGKYYLYNWTSKNSSTLKISYSNYSLATPNFIEAVFKYLTQGSPSSGVTLTVSQNMLDYNLANVSFTPPTYVDSTQGQELPISSTNPIIYLITYTPQSNAVSYNSVFNTEIKSAERESSETMNQVIQINSLFPDTKYTLNMKLKNKNNTDDDTNSVTTPPIELTTKYFEPIYTTLIKINESNIDLTFEKYSAKKVSDGSEVYIVKGNITGTVTYNIHNNYSKRGVNGGSNVELVKDVYAGLYRDGLNNNILTTQLTEICKTNNTFSVYGWGNDVASSTNANKILMGVTKKDAHSTYVSDTETKTALSGYYQKGEFSTIVYFNTDNFTASEYAYSIKIKGTYPAANTSNNTQLQISKISPSFYYDGDLPTPTCSITALSISISTTPVYICGIAVFQSNITVSPIITVTDIGTYFYNSSKTLSYSGTIGTTAATLNILTETALPSGYSTSTPKSGTFSNNLTFSAIFNNYSTSLSLEAKSYNINNVSATGTKTLSIIYDSVSVIATTIPTLSANTETNGCRIYSTTLAGTNENDASSTNMSDINNFTNNGNSYSNTVYNNSTSLNSTTYTKELLYANGKYVTPACTQNYYINYTGYEKNTVNYSTITSSSSYRYVTFCWKVDPDIFNQSISYGNLLFTVYSTDGTVSNGIANTDKDPIQLYYRVEDPYSLSIPNASGKVITTYWINANSSTGNLITANNCYIGNSITNYLGVSPANCTKNTIKLEFPAKTGGYTFSSASVLNTSKLVYIYCRIGISLQSNFSFTKISCKLT